MNFFLPLQTIAVVNPSVPSKLAMVQQHYSVNTTRVLYYDVYNFTRMTHVTTRFVENYQATNCSPQIKENTIRLVRTYRFSCDSSVLEGKLLHESDVGKTKKKVVISIKNIVQWTRSVFTFEA